MNLLVTGTRAALLAATLAAAALLASCGGGDPVVPFEPTRVLAFGDENSVITADGRKYTVNGFTTDSNGVKTQDCAVNAIWVQRLAASYGLVFPQCKGTVVDPRSRIYAEAGAMVADLAVQIQNHIDTPDSFSSKDLVTMLVGQNDVLEQYALYPTVPGDQLLAAVYQRGLALAAQVSRVADAGGRVLVSTVPDLTYSPYASAQNTGTGDNTRAALIGALVAKFNEGLRVGIAKESGAEVAIMLTDELVQSMAKFPTSYGGMTNVTVAVCDPALAATVDLCTTDTLVTNGTALNHLWADDRHLSANGHIYLGALADSRSRANPF